MGEKQQSFLQRSHERVKSARQFRATFWLWLQWCRRGFPRKEGCLVCGMVEWHFGAQRYLCHDSDCIYERKRNLR